MDSRVIELIEDLKSYLEYLKGMGIEFLPKATGPVTQTPLSSSESLAFSSTLKDIRQEMEGCKRCKLHRTRKSLVFGEGNEKAILMFIGEGPGYDEDIQGRPFVGKAGQLLTKIIQSINLQREEVYIANIVKCRPPQNRNPEPDEITACRLSCRDRSRPFNPESSVPWEPLPPNPFSRQERRSVRCAEGALI